MASYFKPKQKVPKSPLEQQPFYVSWFQQQGQELKRGGTAPHESRKAMEQMRNQAQPTIFRNDARFILIYKLFKGYLHQNLPKIIYKRFQKFTLVYQHNLKQYLKERVKSAKESKYHKDNLHFLQQLEDYESYQPSRTQTQQMQTRTLQQAYTEEEKRPITQQQTKGQWRINKNVRENEETQRIFDNDADIELDEQYSENDENKIDNSIGKDNNLDAASIESQGAESKRNSLSPRQQQIKEAIVDSLANRSAFHQRGEVTHIVENLRKTNVNMHRPMTSEGGRRKRVQNNLINIASGQQIQNVEARSMTIQQNELQYIEKEMEEPIVTKSDQKQMKINKNFGVDGECQLFQDFEDVEFFIKDPIIVKSTHEGLRSGYRGKPSEEQNILQNDSNIQQIENNQRPPSRSKLPPQAIGLEVPNTRDLQDIPIRNMYANMEVEPSFEEFKINNNMNTSNFMKINENEDTIKRRNYAEQGERQTSAIFTSTSHNKSRNHPQSANNNKYKNTINMQMMNNNNFLSPHSLIQTPHQSKIAQTASLNQNNFEIVIKHNTSSNIQKVSNPVKVPFQTSLGQDFLRLFANQHISN